jgi:2'-5' RNA ligase
VAVLSASPVTDPVAAAWYGKSAASRARAVELASAPGLTSRSGMISLDLPEGTIKPVPGGLTDHHVTVVYLGHDLDDGAFALACSRAKDAAASADGPLTGTVQGADSFTPSAGSDGKVPAFAPAVIPGAQALRSKLDDLSASEHKDWIPHVTLAYLGKGDPLPGPVPPTSVKFSHLSVHRGDDVRRFALGSGSELAGDAPAIDLSALTPVYSSTPSPLGRPGGPGLWFKGWKLPDYVENVARGIMQGGQPDESMAIATAIAACKRWATGAGNVTPEVRAASAKAIAEWEALKAAAPGTPGHDHASDAPAIDLAFIEQDHPRVPAGQKGGGQFGSKGGAEVSKARARHSAKVPAATVPATAQGQMTRVQQLRFQAASDRQLAQKIMVQIAGLVRARNAASVQVAASAPSKAGVSATASTAAVKAASTYKASPASATATSASSAARANVAKLDGQIRLLRDDARALIKSADHLDAEADGQ